MIDDNSVKTLELIEVKELGYAYGWEENQLIGIPMNKDGTLSYESWCIVELISEESKDKILELLESFGLNKEEAQDYLEDNIEIE